MACWLDTVGVVLVLLLVTVVKVAVASTVASSGLGLLEDVAPRVAFPLGSDSELTPTL